MSRTNIERARLVSPTLRRRRSSSTQRAVGMRERMARAVGEKKVQVHPGYLARAEPFVDESLHDKGKGAWGWRPWIALLLAGASAGTCFIVVSAIQST